jgi:hypothetical protein
MLTVNKAIVETDVPDDVWLRLATAAFTVER